VNDFRVSPFDFASVQVERHKTQVISTLQQKKENLDGLAITKIVQYISDGYSI
jgi:hypothetical protein